MARSIAYISMLLAQIAWGQSVYAQQQLNRNSPNQVYFFAVSEFDKENINQKGADNSIPCNVGVEKGKPSNEFHNGRVVAAVYFGEDSNPDSNYSNIKLYYTFKVYYHSGSSSWNFKLIGSYKLTAKLSQRRIWKVLHLKNRGLYTVKVFRRFFKEPIAEGTLAQK